MSRFILQRASDPGYWIATDTQTGCVCRFKEGNFNGDQKFTFVNETNDNATIKAFGVTGIASAANRLTEWLIENHRSLL